MNGIIWMRFCTATALAAAIMFLGVSAVTVRADQRSGTDAGSVWTCHPNHARGQLACLNRVDGRQTIIAARLN